MTANNRKPIVSPIVSLKIKESRTPSCLVKPSRDKFTRERDQSQHFARANASQYHSACRHHRRAPTLQPGLLSQPPCSKGRKYWLKPNRKGRKRKTRYENVEGTWFCSSTCGTNACSAWRTFLRSRSVSANIDLMTRRSATRERGEKGGSWKLNRWGRETSRQPAL